MIEDKLLVKFMNRIMHDEVHDLTNIISLINMVYESEDSKIGKGDLLLMKVYFTGRLGLITMEDKDGEPTIQNVYHKLREQFGV